MKPNIAAAIVIVLLSGGLAGCAALAPSDDGCVPRPRVLGTGSQPYAGWELRILTHGAWGWTYDAVRGDFENKTGARLTQIEAADAGSAVQEAILNKGNPVADVVWGIDNALFAKANRESVLHAYQSPHLGRIHDYIDVDQFRSEDGRLLATPADHGYISINFDRQLLDENGTGGPTTLAELATEEYASTFVTQDPRTSSPGLGFLIATVATFPEGSQYHWTTYWEDLFDRGVLVTNDWTTAYTYHYSANGFGTEGAPLDRKIVTSYTTSPAAEVYFGSFEEPAGVSLEPPGGVFHQVETVAILACTPHLGLAKAFVDYVLTSEFQSTIPDTQAIYPIVAGVAVPQTFNDYATDPADLRPAAFSAQELGRDLEEWVTTWEALFREHYA